jgi:hypothetical protein
MSVVKGNQGKVIDPQTGRVFDFVGLEGTESVSSLMEHGVINSMSPLRKPAPA